jgi:hypothetical protein
MKRIVLAGLLLLAGCSGGDVEVGPGACLDQAATQIAECTDSVAVLQVAGVADDSTVAEAIDKCKTFEGADRYVMWGKPDEAATAGTRGKILCLKPKA